MEIRKGQTSKCIDHDFIFSLPILEQYTIIQLLHHCVVLLNGFIFGIWLPWRKQPLMCIAHGIIFSLANIRAIYNHLFVCYLIVYYCTIAYCSLASFPTWTLCFSFHLFTHSLLTIQLPSLVLLILLLPYNSLALFLILLVPYNSLALFIHSLVTIQLLALFCAFFYYLTFSYSFHNL